MGLVGKSGQKNEGLFLWELRFTKCFYFEIEAFWKFEFPYKKLPVLESYNTFWIYTECLPILNGEMSNGKCVFNALNADAEAEADTDYIYLMYSFNVN